MNRLVTSLVIVEAKDLPPLLAPVVAAAAVWLQERLRARDERYRAQVVRSQAVEMVEFLEKWMKAQEMACSPEEFQQIKRVVRQQLDETYATLDKVHKSRPQRSETRPLAQRVLLLNRPASFSGWAARVLFYGVIVVASFFSIGIFSDFKSSDIGLSIVFYVLCLVLILPLHAWALRADAQGGEPKPAGPPASVA